MKVITRIQKRVPLNMLWDRFELDKRLAAAAAKLKSKNQNNTHDSVFVQNPHSS